MTRYTIETVKGNHTGDLRAIAAWQAEHQAAFATVRRADGVSVNVNDVEFDGADLDAAIDAIEARFAEEVL